MALVLEDGTGKTNANAYSSVADVDTYLADYARNDVAWTGATATEKETYIIEGTQTLNLFWGGALLGRKGAYAQALEFPRINMQDRDGYAVPTNVVPNIIKQATAELAFRHACLGGADSTTGDTSKIIADIDDGGQLVKESVAVGSIKISEEFMGGGKREQVLYSKIELILNPLLAQAGELRRA